MATRQHFARAICSGKSEKVKKLLKKTKISKVRGTYSGYSLLKLAIKHKKSEIAKLILKNKCKVNKKSNRKTITLIHYASRAGNLELVKLLVQNGADINAQTQNGSTPIYLATKMLRERVVKYLLEQGALVNIKSTKTLTAIHYACFNNDLKCVKMIVKHDNSIVNPTDPKESHPIQTAVGLGYWKIVAFLLDYINNVNLRYLDEDHKMTNGPFIHRNLPGENPTLLLWACVMGDLRTAELLIDYYADVTLTTKYSKYSPMMLAAQSHNIELVKLLVPFVDPADEDYRGNTAIHYVFFNQEAFINRYCKEDYYYHKNKYLIVKELARWGFELDGRCDIPDAPQLTSLLDLAIFFGCWAVVKFLLYSSAIGLKQLEYDKIELAAHRNDDIDDSIREDDRYVEMRMSTTFFVQSMLSLYIFSRNIIGFETCEDTLKKIDTLIEENPNNVWFEKYYPEAHEILMAVEELKKLQVNGSDITLYDVVSRKPDDVVKLAFNMKYASLKNDEIEEICSNDKYSFYYGYILKYNINYSLKKSRILINTVDIIYKKLLKKSTPYDCCLEILKFLPYEDINRLQFL